MKSAECPYCAESVFISGTPYEGKHLRCSHCGEFAEVVALDPIELDYLYQYDDDDEYRDYRFDYDH